MADSLPKIHCVYAFNIINSSPYPSVRPVRHGLRGKRHVYSCPHNLLFWSPIFLLTKLKAIKRLIYGSYTYEIARFSRTHWQNLQNHIFVADARKIYIFYTHGSGLRYEKERIIVSHTVVNGQIAGWALMED